MRRLLFLLVPACLLSGYAALRAVRDTGQRVASDVTATFRADSLVLVSLPVGGTYRAVGIGSRAAIQRVGNWEITARARDTGAEDQVVRASAPRAKDRENRPGLDLLFTLRAAAPGVHELRFGGRTAADTVTIRLTRVDNTTARAAMRAFGLATLFSVLLLASAGLWFRR